MNIEVKKPSEIPAPDGVYSETAKSIKCSDFYFAIAKSGTTGETFKCIVCYDFKCDKWRGVQAGVTEIIEYYVFTYPIETDNHIYEDDRCGEDCAGCYICCGPSACNSSCSGCIECGCDSCGGSINNGKCFCEGK